MRSVVVVLTKGVKKKMRETNEKVLRHLQEKTSAEGDQVDPIFIFIFHFCLSK